MEGAFSQAFQICSTKTNYEDNIEQILRLIFNAIDTNIHISFALNVRIFFKIKINNGDERIYYL